MPVYSELCDNPDTMVILDLVTGKTYSQEQAQQQPPEIRRRLLNHCTKQGYLVMTIDEARVANERRITNERN